MPCEFTGIFLSIFVLFKKECLDVSNGIFQVVEDTVNPVWDEFYRFLVFNAKYQELNLDVSLYEANCVSMFM